MILDDVILEYDSFSVSVEATGACIVEAASFRVRRGEIVALVGESGSGKTTLAHAALGYIKPGLAIGGGEVRFDSADIAAMSADALRRFRGMRVAYMPQSAAAAFNPAIRIGEQVIESAVLHGGLTRAEALARARDLYAALDLPDSDRIGERYPHQVSGGQLQRLGAAMALCPGPDLLVLDEPTTALDVTTQVEVMRAILKVLADRNMGGIYVSHDLAAVAQVADRVVVLRNGIIQEDQPIRDLLASPRSDYTHELFSAVRALEYDDAGSGPSETPALQIDTVAARYAGQARPVIEDITLDLPRSRVTGIIGESGSGKSSLAQVIAGLHPTTQGRIVMEGEMLPPLCEARTREQLRRIQIVFQMADTALNPRQSIAEIIGRPLTFYHGMRGRARRERAAELLRMVDLDPSFLTRPPQSLSGGQKQRVNLARALAAEPELILCDEVTSALDTIVAARVIDLLKRLQRDTGVTLVFISHDLSTIAGLADRIVVLYAGRVVEVGPTADVLGAPAHPYTRMLIASVPELRPGWLDGVPPAIRGDRGISETHPAGCNFFGRCPMARKGLCDVAAPPLQQAASAAGPHATECHFPPEASDTHRLTAGAGQRRALI